VAVVVVVALVPVLYLLDTPHHFFDLKIYMKAMRWWADGHSLYDYVQADQLQGELFFTYPPFAALLLRPFAGLRVWATATIFTTLSLAALMATTWWLVKPLADRHRMSRWFAMSLAVPLVLSVESTRETLTFGQINMLLVTLILADLLFAVPRGSRWAGVGIGLAMALKLYPGIFVVYLLVARKWRAALVASATAAGATVLAAAIAPADSWRFWTRELWLTDRVGRPDYTGNQSLFGLLSRLTTPDGPDQLLWLLLVAVISGYGLWRAASALRAGDHLTGLTLTGLVGALASPITWTHHVYWFIPALVVLVDAGLGRPDATPGATGRRRRFALLALAVLLAVGIVYGVVSFYDWGHAFERTNSPGEFLLRNVYVLFALILLVALPIQAESTGSRRPRSGSRFWV
jgi:alpha-1,2-mannosyltransferase